MFHNYVDLVGGPLDGGQELLEQCDDEIRVLYDFTEALISSSYMHYWPLTEARYDSIEFRLLEPRKTDPNHGWQVLLYRRGPDGRYYFVRKLSGLDPS
jgi:hypothetical protein